MKSYSVVSKELLFLFDAAKIARLRRNKNNISFKLYQKHFKWPILYDILPFIYGFVQLLIDSCFDFCFILFHFCSIPFMESDNRPRRWSISFTRTITCWCRLTMVFGSFTKRFAISET